MLVHHHEAGNDRFAEKIDRGARRRLHTATVAELDDGTVLDDDGLIGEGSGAG
jgi:hypothetical protein